MVMYNATKPITGQSTWLAKQLTPSLAYNSKNNQLNTVAALTGSPAGTSTVNGYTPTVSTIATIPSTTGAYSSVNYNPTTTTTSSTGGHDMSKGTSTTTPVNVNQATVGSSDVYAAELKQLQDELASIKARNAMADTYNQNLLNYNTDALGFYKNILGGNAPTGIYGDLVKGYSDTESQQRMKELINPLREQMNLVGLTDSDSMNRSVAEAAANTMLESNKQQQSGMKYALSLLSQAPSEYYNPAQPLTAQTFSDLQNYLDYDLTKQSEAFQESQALRAYNDAQKEKEEAEHQAIIDNMKARLDKAKSSSTDIADKYITYAKKLDAYMDTLYPMSMTGDLGNVKGSGLAEQLIAAEYGAEQGDLSGYMSGMASIANAQANLNKSKKTDTTIDEARGSLGGKSTTNDTAERRGALERASSSHGAGYNPYGSAAAAAKKAKQNGWA